MEHKPVFSFCVSTAVPLYTTINVYLPFVCTGHHNMNLTLKRIKTYFYYWHKNDWVLPLTACCYRACIWGVICLIWQSVFYWNGPLLACSHTIPTENHWLNTVFKVSEMWTCFILNDFAEGIVQMHTPVTAGFHLAAFSFRILLLWKLAHCHAVITGHFYTAVPLLMLQTPAFPLKSQNSLCLGSIVMVL